MKKIILKQINNINYTFIDEKNNIYILKLDLDEVVNINDIFYINNKLLNNNNLLSFGSINSIYGKKLNNILEEEILIIKKNNSSDYIYLKRLYG